MFLLVYNGKGGDSAKVYLPFQGLFFLFYFQMVMNFPTYLAKTMLTSQKGETIRIQGERATYLKPCS